MKDGVMRMVLIGLMVSGAIGAWAGQTAAQEGAEDAVVRISAAELEDKVRGGLLGQLLGNLNGLEHEFRYYAEPGQVESYTPGLPDGAVTDDDTDIEWVYVAAMQQRQELLLPYADVADLWRAHISDHIWSSNRYARTLMDLEILPPLTGRVAINPWAEFNISGQFVCESFGLVAPAMPRSAAELGVHYLHVTVDDEPLQTTQMFTTMVAQAFVEEDVNALLDAGLAAVDPTSRVAEIVADVRRWHAENPADWRATRQKLAEKWRSNENTRQMRSSNGYELNTGCTIAALLYGGGDFVETLRLAFSLGWDADNNAATAGTILGVIHGRQWMDEQGWAVEDVYRNTRRSGMPDDETITRFGDRLIAVAQQVVKEAGGKVRLDDAGEVTAYEIRQQTPRNVEPMTAPEDRIAELREQWLPTIEAELDGEAQQRARAAYLAICLDEAGRLEADQPEAWQRAVETLTDEYPQVVEQVFTTPGEAGAALQRRAKAAGLTSPD